MALRQLDDTEYMEQFEASVLESPGLRQRIRKAWLRFVKLWLSSVKQWAVFFAPNNTPKPVAFWASTLERLTLNLEDQQLITGPLILVSALIRYVPSSDWVSLAIAFDVAFFSAVTHFVSLRTLRSYMREHPRMALEGRRGAWIDLSNYLKI